MADDHQPLPSPDRRGAATEHSGVLHPRVLPTPPSRIGYVFALLGCLWLATLSAMVVLLMNSPQADGPPTLVKPYDSAMMDVIEQRLEEEEE
ncbi:hypothetical protein HY523_01165 [Candidatus Berkelbacteria bacterium]|nr:hypothetical protein [Candidatus Berkelbacteria bacterium]